MTVSGSCLQNKVMITVLVLALRESGSGSEMAVTTNYQQGPTPASTGTMMSGSHSQDSVSVALSLLTQ